MNIYLLIAGILALLLAVAHSLWGEKVILKEVNKSELGNDTKTGFIISWYQISLVLAVVGTSSIVAAFLVTLEVVRSIGIVVLCIVAGNFLIFLILGLIKHKEIIKASIPQAVLFSVLIILLILGIVL